ncbi:MAG: glutathione S-transferase N-terminal domain-containing protein [Actinomycetota bacterium]|nr:glutathione S-transferase N-terminal domain-containing protein [Actinomycetota bacterium]
MYTCELDRGGPKIHPCRRAHEALTTAGHSYETVVFDGNRPLGLFTKGKRPKLKELSGQEKLPVLRLTDGTTVSGSGRIVAWAKEHAPGA